jgi:hypothetical protein
MVHFKKGEGLDVRSVMIELRYRSDSEALRGLHLSCAMCPFLAVVRVNSAPHLGQKLFEAVPDFSR